MANHFCLTGSALCFIGLSFVGCNYLFAEIVIMLIITVNSTSMSGYMVRVTVLLRIILCSTRNVFDKLLQLYCMDISPNFSAIIFGFANASASFAGLIDSALLGYLIEGNVRSTAV